mmetsp:Transcript_18429/g.37423  ORF Transcript_18429/g.37423 Transcript_18429/m.37423 type:complete len:480 (-) Transcript_18429:208-1647(-)
MDAASQARHALAAHHLLRLHHRLRDPDQAALHRQGDEHGGSLLCGDSGQDRNWRMGDAAGQGQLLHDRVLHVCLGRVRVCGGDDGAGAGRDGERHLRSVHALRAHLDNLRPDLPPLHPLLPHQVLRQPREAPRLCHRAGRRHRHAGASAGRRHGGHAAPGLLHRHLQELWAARAAVVPVDGAAAAGLGGVRPARAALAAGGDAGVLGDAVARAARPGEQEPPGHHRHRHQGHHAGPAARAQQPRGPAQLEPPARGDRADAAGGAQRQHCAAGGGAVAAGPDRRAAGGRAGREHELRERRGPGGGCDQERAGAGPGRRPLHRQRPDRPEHRHPPRGPRPRALPRHHLRPRRRGAARAGGAAGGADARAGQSQEAGGAPGPALRRHRAPQPRDHPPQRGALPRPGPGHCAGGADGRGPAEYRPGAAQHGSSPQHRVKPAPARSNAHRRGNGPQGGRDLVIFGAAWLFFPPSSDRPSFHVVE